LNLIPLEAADFRTSVFSNYCPIVYYIYWQFSQVYRFVAQICFPWRLFGCKISVVLL
jgi:hypothetical protein